MATLSVLPAASLLASDADDRAALEAVMKTMEPGKTYALNLGSDEQYAYVRAMLRRSKASKKTIAAVESARKSAAAGPMTAEATPAGPAALDVIEYVASDGRHATTALLSTVPGGTSSTSMMVSFLVNGNIFASSPQYQEIDGGKHFVASFKAAIPRADAGAAVTASALFIATFQGMPHFYSTMTTAGPGIARVQCVTGPNHGKNQSGSIPCPTGRSSCTNENLKKSIVVCIGKKGPCNYVISSATAQFPFTISGTIEFPSPIDPALSGMYVLDLQTGDGACPVASSGKVANPLTSEFFSVDPRRPRVLRYCIPNSAVPASGCFGTSKVGLALTVYAQVTLPGDKKAMATAVVSSDPAVAASGTFVARMPAITVHHR